MSDMIPQQPREAFPFFFSFSFQGLIINCTADHTDLSHRRATTARQLQHPPII